MYTKEMQLKNNRIKPLRRNVTRITQSVRREVLNRSEGYCERCGKHSSYGMEMAHLIQASSGGSGNDKANVVLLCGPSVNTGTCHNWVDYTSSGREWRLQKRQELLNYYGERL